MDIKKIIALVLIFAPSWFYSNICRAEDSFSFAVIGDTQTFTGSSKGGLQRAVKQIKQKNVGLVMDEGDMLHSCFGGRKCEKKFNQWKRILGGLMSKTYATMGNHDNSGGSAISTWQKVFDFPNNGPAGYSELTYSFDYANSHFVVLDTEKPNGGKRVDLEQRQWLENDLASNTKENTFVFFHEPAWSTSTDIGTGDSLDKNLSERDALWTILDKYNVTVFNGHEHFFSEKIVDSSVFPTATHSIYQFTVGRTDVNKSDHPKSGHYEYAYRGKHFAIVEVNGQQITLKLYTLGGNLIKSISFSQS